MKKNITVLDTYGRRCASTWPRRAAGLVQKGRACYVGPYTIRLACPIEKEDMAVEEQERMQQQEMYDLEIEHLEQAPAVQVEEQPALVPPPEPAMHLERPAPHRGMEPHKPPRHAPPIPPQYVMDTIDKVLADNGHLTAALMTIEKMPNNCPEDGRAAAIASIVQAREATHQKLLGLLERMYADMEKP